MGSHDKLFKAVFSDPTNAVAHFEGFLPEELTAALDLAKAEHVPGSFVDEALTERHTDLLYRIPRRTEAVDENREVLLYLVFERECCADVMVPYRVVCYAMRIWERWLEEQSDPRLLPPILPLIIHHREQGETNAPEHREHWIVESIAPTTVAAIGAFLPNVRVVLDGSTEPTGGWFSGPTQLPVTLLPYQQERGPELFGLMPNWKGEFQTGEWLGHRGSQYLALIVQYLLTVNETITLESLAEALAPLVDEAKEITMTVGKLLKEQGRREGENIGLQKGREEGRHEARLEVARKLLSKGMSVGDVTALTDLPLHEVTNLPH